MVTDRGPKEKSCSPTGNCSFQITPVRMTVREDEPGKPIVASTAFPINGAGTDFTVNKDLVLNVKKGGASPEDIVVSKETISIKENELKSDEALVTSVRDFVDDGSKKAEVSFTLVDEHPGESNFWEGYQIDVQAVGFSIMFPHVTLEQLFLDQLSPGQI